MRYCVERLKNAVWQPMGRSHTVPDAQQMAQNIVAFYDVPKDQVRIMERETTRAGVSGWAEVVGQPNR